VIEGNFDNAAFFCAFVVVHKPLEPLRKIRSEPNAHYAIALTRAKAIVCVKQRSKYLLLLRRELRGVLASEARSKKRILLRKCIR
jgi:hypothetical protein